MGLTKVQNREILLSKEASEGINTKNVTKLVTEEAYSIIASVAPQLMKYIVGITMDKNESQNTIIGGANLLLDGKKYTIPIVYNGRTTMTGTMIYNEGTDVMLGLTKKMISKMLSEGSSLSGDVPTRKVAFDKGDMKKLFTPPTTFAPKVASSSIIYSASENSLVKTAFFNFLDSNPDFIDTFVDAYGSDFIETILDDDLNKEASAVVDLSEPKVVCSMRELAETDWIFKESAAKEIAHYGVAISVGEDRQTKKLIPIESPESILKSSLNIEALTTIGSDGFYDIFNKDGNKVEQAIAITSGGNSGLYTENGRVSSFKTVVGKETELRNVGFLNLMSRKNASDCDRLIILKDGKLYKLVDVYDKKFNMSSIEMSCSGVNEFSKIVVSLGSDSQPRISLKVLYVGDSNARVTKYKASGYRGNFARLSDLDNPAFAKDFYESSNIIKVHKDTSGDFIYGGKLQTQDTLAQRLLNEGYDKLSVLTLLKTSASKESSMFAEISGKMDNIAQAVINLSGRIQNIEGHMSQEKERQALQVIENQHSQVDTNSQEAQMQEQQMQEQQQAQQQQAQQQQQEQQMQQQQPSIGGFNDPSAGAPQQQQQGQDILAERQAQEQAQQQEMQQKEEFNKQMISEGINPNMDPSVLQSVMSLKDTKIMDIASLTMLAQNSDLKVVLEALTPDFQAGTSALAKIVFNILSREDEITSAIGGSQYKKLLIDLKTMLMKSTDILIDIVQASKSSVEE